MLRRRSTLVTLFFVLTLSSGSGETPSAEPADAEESWSAAEAAAIAEWKNSEGKNYGRSLEKSFSKDHSATIGVCANEAQKPDLSTFTLLLRIDAEGRPTSAWRILGEARCEDESRLGACPSHRKRQIQSGDLPLELGVSRLEQRTRVVPSETSIVRTITPNGKHCLLSSGRLLTDLYVVDGLR